MTPWERRLRDLADLLSNCASTYFEPDNFRRNLNQFLQTSRTVTFLIQKQKGAIPGFESWYSANVLNAWKADSVMEWAKDARNQIEKEGDLDLHSSMRATLIFSYLQEEDVMIDCGRTELLNANVKRLIRLAEKKLPTGVSDAAIVKVERRWITASLPDWELLHALSYVYTRMHKCCTDLAHHLGTTIEPSIPRRSAFDQVREDVRNVQYVKFRGKRVLKYVSEPKDIVPDMVLPARFQEVIDNARASGFAPKSLKEALTYYSNLARTSFEHFGSHVPIAIVFDENWVPIQIHSTSFQDQADKYIFWRILSERLAGLNVQGLIFISEAWIRSVKHPVTSPIREMPIMGECLHVIGFDKSGNIQKLSWTISRITSADVPSLQENKTHGDDGDWQTPAFLVPAMRAMGIT
jgi:hypothetical protein